MAEISSTHRVKLAISSFLRSRVEPGDVMLIGVSGGADSLALAAGCAALAAELSVTFVPVIVDHQLQINSAEVAQQALGECHKLGLDRAFVVKVDVVETGEGLEAAARKARYRAFHDAMAQTAAVGILLAHSLEDQAETVLMRLSRGSGTRSISAIAPEQGVILRPLLDVHRQTLVEVCEENSLNFYSDPHNDDEKFLRVKVRKNLMPLLREVLGEAVDEALARTASMARDDADALDSFADKELHGRLNDGELDIANLQSLPRAVSTRCIRLWLATHGITTASNEQIESVWRLATDTRVQGPIKVVGGVDIYKSSGRLRA